MDEREQMRREIGARTKATTPRRVKRPKVLEKVVEREIMQALQRLGFAVSKTSQPRASMITRGIPDLYASHPVWQIRAWIEVKAGDNTPSIHQRVWHEQERAAGGLVIVAYSVRDVVIGLIKAGAPIRATV